MRRLSGEKAIELTPLEWPSCGMISILGASIVDWAKLNVGRNRLDPRTTIDEIKWADFIIRPACRLATKLHGYPAEYSWRAGNFDT
jgi:hypothetical protein